MQAGVGLASLQAEGRAGPSAGSLGPRAVKALGRLVQPPWFVWLVDRGSLPPAQGGFLKS